MKNTLVMFALLVAGSSASAATVNRNSSWTEIMENKKTLVSVPQIPFPAGEATTFVNVFGVCVDEGMMRTIRPMNIYAHVGNKDNSGIEVVGQDYLETPRKYKKQYNLGSEKHGDRFEVIEEQYSLKYDIEVHRVGYGKADIDAPWFTKSYTIPNCQ